MRGLVEDLGLTMIETGQDFLTRDLIGTNPIPDDDHQRLTETLFDVIEALGPAAEATTIADLLETVGEEGPAMTVLRSRLAGTYGVELSEVSASDLDEEFGLSQASTYLRVDGGNDRLAVAMAEQLDVFMSSPVNHIRQDTDTVTALCDDKEYRADSVVVAVPMPILKHPGFLGDPPDVLRQAIDSIGMGTAAKIAAATLYEPPMFRRQDPGIPGWYWTGAGPDGRTRHAVTGFAGTRRGVAVLTAEAPMRLARAVPETPLSGAPLVVDWGADPWAGGCYSALGPGQRGLLASLRQRWGRIVFAGEHVNGSGTIDGAIRSGRDAARLLLGTI